MNLIEKSDPQYFTETSDLSYDRHHYKVFYHDGETKVVESWEEAQLIWWNTAPQLLSHIEILDKKEVKGFK